MYSTGFSMTTSTLPLQNKTQPEFQTSEVMTIVGGHFIHDIYTAFVAPLLPVIIDKLSLTLTEAGSLTAILQFPAVLNVFIGYLADRVSLRYFVILAPAVTATLISAIGLASDYWTMGVILFLTGVSVAAFHAPTPAMIARISGRQVGKGMSFYMAAGELARTLGPIIAVWAVSTWTLSGIYRLAVVGWASSLVLYWRLRKIPARPAKVNGLVAVFPAIRRLFLPILVFLFFRNFIDVSLTTFLPVYMNQAGASLWLSGAALAILEAAGVAGALLSGTISDRIGRRPILLYATIASVIFMMILLNSSGWVMLPVLVALGFVTLSTMPVLLALVQECLPENRAVGNGLFMTLTSLLRPVSILLIGYLGDHFGLQTAFWTGTTISLLAIPMVFTLPQAKKPPE